MKRERERERRLEGDSAVQIGRVARGNPYYPHLSTSVVVPSHDKKWRRKAKEEKKRKGRDFLLLNGSATTLRPQARQTSLALINQALSHTCVVLDAMYVYGNKPAGEKVPGRMVFLFLLIFYFFLFFHFLFSVWNGKLLLINLDKTGCSAYISPNRFSSSATGGVSWGLKGKMEKHGVRCYNFSSFHISFLIFPFYLYLSLFPFSFFLKTESALLLNFQINGRHFFLIVKSADAQRTPGERFHRLYTLGNRGRGRADPDGSYPNNHNHIVMKKRGRVSLSMGEK